VDEDDEVYKNLMIAYIDKFNIFMNQFEIDLRSGSFLDMDTKLHDKYIGDGSDVDYNKLVSLNVELKLSITKLR